MVTCKTKRGGQVFIGAVGLWFTPRTKRGGQVFIGAVGLRSHLEQRGVARCLLEQWVCGHT